MELLCEENLFDKYSNKIKETGTKIVELVKKLIEKVKELLKTQIQKFMKGLKARGIQVLVDGQLSRLNTISKKGKGAIKKFETNLKNSINETDEETGIMRMTMINRLSDEVASNINPLKELLDITKKLNSEITSSDDLSSDRINEFSNMISEISSKIKSISIHDNEMEFQNPSLNDIKTYYSYVKPFLVVLSKNLVNIERITNQIGSYNVKTSEILSKKVTDELKNRDTDKKYMQLFSSMSKVSVYALTSSIITGQDAIKLLNLNMNIVSAAISNTFKEI